MHPNPSLALQASCHQEWDAKANEVSFSNDPAILGTEH